MGQLSKREQEKRNSNVAQLVNDFNKLTETGIYAYGGQNFENKPRWFWSN